jgi:hypothetical protein
MYVTWGVAQWSTHPPQEQRIRNRIPPNCEVFTGNLAKL